MWPPLLQALSNIFTRVNLERKSEDHVFFTCFLGFEHILPGVVPYVSSSAQEELFFISVKPCLRTSLFTHFYNDIYTALQSRGTDRAILGNHVPL